jgi:hypothetical protein
MGLDFARGTRAATAVEAGVRPRATVVADCLLANAFGVSAARVLSVSRARVECHSALSN